MGSGSWNTDSFVTYSTTSKCATVDSLGIMHTDMTNQEMFKSRRVDASLDPKNVIRECRDSEEHPNTKPVILALDVTGSMGNAAVEVAKMLNVIMTRLYDQVEDVEFCIMGIGDLYCDRGPIQISQFESDIRIAEQLDKVWFEFGGGGNLYESYTAAWYMGTRHCDLDCWKRGDKGIIITIGDECCNPYLEKEKIYNFVGDIVQADIETESLFAEASQKYNIYHIQVDHDGYPWNETTITKSWQFLGDHFKRCNLDAISDTIIEIISNPMRRNDSKGISW